MKEDENKVGVLRSHHEEVIRDLSENKFSEVEMAEVRPEGIQDGVGGEPEAAIIGCTLENRDEGKKGHRILANGLKRIGCFRMGETRECFHCEWTEIESI